MMQEPINVHGGPSETANTRSQSSLEIVDVGCKQTTSVWSDLVHDANALSYNILKLVVVVLELLFLEEHDFGTFGNFNSNTRQTLSFADESEDFTVEVHIELKVLIVTNE